MGKYTLNVDAVRARMLRLGVTNTQLVDACNINVRTLQRWFAGQPVSSSDAERLAQELRLGTGDAFLGVSESNLWTRLLLLQRFINSRDTAIAQSLRISAELSRDQPQTTFYDAHPVHGYLSQHAITKDMHHGFVPFAVHPLAGRIHVQVRVRLGRRLAYASGDLYLNRGRAHWVELWSVNAMRAVPRADGSIVLWLWLSPEAASLMFVGDQDFDVEQLAEVSKGELNLDEPEMAHGLIGRPGQPQLRSARLPVGFDRIYGTREGRLGVPVYEIPGGVQEASPTDGERASDNQEPATPSVAKGARA